MNCGRPALATQAQQAHCLLPSRDCLARKAILYPRRVSDLESLKDRLQASQTSPMRAGGWSAVSFIISQGIGSLLYLPLARLLVPDDFGVITEAGLVSGALTLLSEGLLARALIRLPGNRDELAHATLWLSVLIGLLGAALCAGAGLPMAAIYGDARLKPLLALLSLGVLASTLGSVPDALLARELDFRRKTLPETVSTMFGGVAALAAAALGAGVYSLVVYTVARAAVNTIVGWRVIRWWPKRGRPPAAVMRQLLTFGVPASGGDLALYLRLNTDYAISGQRLGSDALGAYTLAWSVTSGPANIIDAFFGGVGYATFARLQRYPERLRAMYLSATRLIAAVALPIFVSGVAIRADLVGVVYGHRWDSMVGPLLPLFLLQGLREVCRPGSSVILATGHNRIYAVCSALTLPLTVVAVLIGTHWGINGVAWAMLLAVGAGSLLWPVIAGWLLRPGWRAAWAVIVTPLLLTGVTTPMVFATRVILQAADAPAPYRLAAAVLVGLASFSLAAWHLLPRLHADLQRLKETLPGEEDAPAPPTNAPILTEADAAAIIAPAIAAGVAPLPDR